MYILLIKTYKKLNYNFNNAAIPFSLSGKVKKKTHSNFLYIAKQLLNKLTNQKKFGLVKTS